MKKGFSFVMIYVLIFVIMVLLSTALIVNHFNQAKSTSIAIDSKADEAVKSGFTNITIMNVSFDAAQNPDFTNITVKNTGSTKIRLSDFEIFLINRIPNSTSNRTIKVKSPDIANPGILDPSETAEIIVKMNLAFNKTHEITISASGATDRVFFANRKDVFYTIRATDNGTDGTTVDTTLINTSNNQRARVLLNANTNRYLRTNHSPNITRSDDLIPMENISSPYVTIYNSYAAVEHYETAVAVAVRELQVWSGSDWVVAGTIPYRGTGTAQEGWNILNTTLYLNQSTKYLNTDPIQMRIRYRTASGTPSGYIDTFIVKMYYTVYWRRGVNKFIGRAGSAQY